MRIIKQTILFGGVSLISLIQIFYLYRQYFNTANFFPDWKIGVNQQLITVSNNHGIHFKIVPINYRFKQQLVKQNNSLDISESISLENSVDSIDQIIKVCNNCYLVDEATKKVFTQKNPNEDIVLKKKLILNGYTATVTNLVKLNPNTMQISIINPIYDKKVLISFDQPSTLYLIGDDKEFRLKINIDNKKNPFIINQKFTFF